MKPHAVNFADIQAQLVEFVKALRASSDETSFSVNASSLPNLGHFLTFLHVSDAIILLEFCVAYLTRMLEEARQHEQVVKKGDLS